MASLLKGFISVVSRNLKTFVKNVRTELERGEAASLITVENNPELIKAVMNELQTMDAGLLLGKLQDIEKAVYHLAGRQQQSIEKEVELEQAVVAMHTTFEEILHGMETMSDLEESEEELLENAWEGKKGAVPLN